MGWLTIAAGAVVPLLLVGEMLVVDGELDPLLLQFSSDANEGVTWWNADFVSTFSFRPAVDLRCSHSDDDELFFWFLLIIISFCCCEVVVVVVVAGGAVGGE